MTSKSFMKLSAITAAMAIILAFANSCDTLNSLEDLDKGESTKDKAIYVITVHEIVKYPRAQELEMNIPSFSGTPICINANYFLHTKNITKIDLIEQKDKPGFFDLNLTLDRRGKMVWSSISVNYRNTQMAFVIDGVYYRSFTPEQLDNDEAMTVRIKGPFDTATAMGLKKNAEKNYKLFNAKD